MLDDKAAHLAELDAEIAACNAAMKELRGTITAAYKAKMTAIEEALEPRTEANRRLRAVEEKATFETLTAYARAQRFAKDADEAIRVAFGNHMATIAPWEAFKARRDDAIARRNEVMRHG